MYKKYATDIVDGKILSCKYTKLACQRFLNDLEQQEQYYFDEKDVKKIFAFIAQLKYWEGKYAGQPIILEPWEQFIVANIYGWKSKETKLRRFTKAFLFTARKNGKTLLASIFLLYDLLTEPGSQSYSISNSKKQAELSFINVKQFVKHNETLAELITSYRDSLVYEKNASKCTALSSDTTRLDGLNPSCAVMDEVAVYKDSKIVDLIQSGQGSRTQPLIIMITTANYIQQSPGYLEHERSKKILEGVITDDRYFCILYQLDEDDSWKDETKYIKANPNLGVTINLQDLIDDRNAAVTTPYKEREFRTKKMNQWLFGTASSWISDEKWKKCIANYEEFKDDIILENALCVGSIDLSKRTDLSCYTLAFYIKSLDKIYLKHKIYIPQAQIEEKIKSDSHLFFQWINQGYITPIPGDVINTDVIFEDIKIDVEKYNLREMGYDPYLSGALVDRLSQIIETIEFQQHVKKMSEPTKDFESYVLNGKIIDANPVMRWCMSNVFIDEFGNNNVKIKKEKSNSSKRIDPVITSIMSLALIRDKIIDEPMTMQDILALF